MQGEKEERQECRDRPWRRCSVVGAHHLSPEVGGEMDGRDALRCAQRATRNSQHA